MQLPFDTGVVNFRRGGIEPFHTPIATEQFHTRHSSTEHIDFFFPNGRVGHQRPFDSRRPILLRGPETPNPTSGVPEPWPGVNQIRTRDLSSYKLQSPLRSQGPMEDESWGAKGCWTDNVSSTSSSSEESNKSSWGLVRWCSISCWRLRTTALTK